MDYGTPTNPVPYIILAYGISFMLLGGYSLWNLLEEKKMAKMAHDLNQTK